MHEKNGEGNRVQAVFDVLMALRPGPAFVLEVQSSLHKLQEHFMALLAHPQLRGDFASFKVKLDQNLYRDAPTVV